MSSLKFLCPEYLFVMIVATFMKSILELFLISAISFSTYSQGNPDAILGNWMNTEGNLKVEVYKQNNEFKAKIIWFDDTDDKSKPMNERMDEKNPDQALRSRKWIGMDVLRDLRYYPNDDEWEDGKIYDGKVDLTQYLKFAKRKSQPEQVFINLYRSCAYAEFA